LHRCAVVARNDNKVAHGFLTNKSIIYKLHYLRS